MRAAAPKRYGPMPGQQPLYEIHDGNWVLFRTINSLRGNAVIHTYATDGYTTATWSWDMRVGRYSCYTFNTLVELRHALRELGLYWIVAPHERR